MRKLICSAILVASVLSGCYFVEVIEVPRKPKNILVAETMSGVGGTVGDYWCPDERAPLWDSPILCEVQEDGYGPIGECCSWRDEWQEQYAGEVCFETWCRFYDYCGWEFVDDWCLR